jgi:uncharacterized protein DUF6572
MTVEEPSKIDFNIIEPQSGEVRLVISDHLDWGEQKGEHLLLLQNKLNSYLAFIESGEIYTKLPKSVGRKIVIEVLGKFPLSDEAKKFYRLVGKAVAGAGFSLRFELLKLK